MLLPVLLSLSRASAALVPGPTPEPAPGTGEPTPAPTESPTGEPTDSPTVPVLDDNIPESEPCSAASNDGLCGLVLDITNSERIAEAANWLVAKPLRIIMLLLLAYGLRWLLHRLIERVAKRAAVGTMGATNAGGESRRRRRRAEVPVVSQRRTQRAEAIASLLKSITTGVIFAIVALMVVAELGYNIAPLIASAGILGLAIGFGAQSLVKDFLSGIFMILEDQYGVGDTCDFGDAIGTVEAVGLRVTRCRDVNGTVWYVRNGEILRVGNMSQNWARTVLDIGVGYGSELAWVREVLKDEAHQLWRDEVWRPLVLEEPEVWGVERFDPDGVVVRLVLKTAPQEQWKVARELRERIKARFDAEGIEMPFPQRVIWMRHGEPPQTATPDELAPDGEAGASELAQPQGPGRQPARGDRAESGDPAPDQV